ncbi:MAG: LamG domain-containing protein, partial [Rhodothermales bacterium]|nr:LamG domain-containing protein [Rhodothermales bacterium]
ASYGDYTGEPGVEHEYGVSAFDDFGQSSVATAPGFRRLSTPTRVDASDGLFEDHVRVTWTDNSRVEIGYVISRDGVPIDTSETNSTEYLDFNAPLGSTMAYGVAAIDPYGSSATSEDDGLASILSPGSFNASESYVDRVVLTWIDRSIIETGYRVTREDLSTTVKQTLATVTAGATGYTDHSAQADAGYEYCVETLGAGGVASSATCDFGARIPPPETAPPPVVTMLTPTTPVTAADQYGYSVTIDSAFAAVGAPGYSSGQGGIFFFERVDGVWTETQVVTGGSLRRELGSGVKMDYPFLVSTAPGFVSGSGNFADQSAYIFRHDGSTWTEEYDSFVEPQVDTGLNIDAHRDFVLIGNPDFENCCGAGRVGEAYLLKRRADGTTWDRIGNPIQQPGGFSGGLGGDANWQNSDFGWSVAMADNYFIVGAPSFLFDFDADPDGRAVVFDYSSGHSPVAFFEVPGQNDVRFGSAVAITNEFAFVGAFDVTLQTGRVYVYAFDETLSQWETTPQRVLEVPGGAINGRFFRSMAAGADAFVLGAYGEDVNPGAVYTSLRSGIGWGDFGDAFSLAAQPGENFGWSVDLWGDTLAVGSPGNTTITGSAHVIDDFGGEELPPPPPTNVAASDGSHDDRIRITWDDTYDGEATFEILRDGELIPDNIEAGATSYNDYRAAPGAVHSYCVRAITAFGTSAEGCDIGRRPPNGALAGRIASRSGSSVGGATLCLSPSPNRGLLLDGEGGGVRVDPVTPSPDITLCSWIRTTSAATQQIVSWSSSESADRLDLKVQGGKLVLSSTDPVTTADIQGSTDVNTGEWLHVCLVVDAGVATLFVDGVPDGSGPAGTAVAADLLTIGATDDGSGLTEALSGQIDEVKLWNHARSTGQIAADRLARSTGREAGLLGYWPFNQTAGASAADLTADPHYGSLAGGVYWTSDGAPIDACASTDEQGNYSFTGLQYGSATTFRVTPTLGARQFDPGFKTINLSV